MSTTRNLSSTLSAYVGKQFFWSILATTLVLVVVVLLGDGIELIRRVSSKNLHGGEIFGLVLLKMPYLMLKLVPFIILLGTINCFARLSKTQELTAIRASGVSVWQFLLGPILVCLGIGAFNITLLNPLAASTLREQERRMNVLFPNHAEGLVTAGGAIWLKQYIPDGEIIIYGAKVQENGTTLENASVFELTGSGGFKERFDASQMTLRDGQWQMQNVARLVPGEEAEFIPQINIATPLTVENIQRSFTSPDTLSVWALPGFIDTLRAAGFSTLAHEVHLQQTFASPALMLAMFLLAIPFALRLQRFGGVGQLMVIGVAVGFAFYLFNNIVAAYSLSGRLNVIVASWLPIAVAGLMGLTLLLHFGEE